LVLTTRGSAATATLHRPPGGGGSNRCADRIAVRPALRQL